MLQWGAYHRAQGRRQRTGWLLANLDHWALLPSFLAAKCGHMIEFWPGTWWRWWVQLPELAHETLSLSPSPAIREEHLHPHQDFTGGKLPSCQVIEFRGGNCLSVLASGVALPDRVVARVTRELNELFPGACGWGLAVQESRAELRSCLFHFLQGFLSKALGKLWKHL